LKVKKRLFLIAAAMLGLSSVSTASPCLAVTADNLASDNGCTLNFGPATFQFTNFSFVINTQTNPGGLTLTDNTISFLLGGTPFDFFGGLSVTGDDQWNISSGAWDFTLGYTISTSSVFGGFAVSETGASATGSGGSITTETVGGSLMSIATTANPNPPRQVVFGSALAVVDVVTNDAGTGTSNLGAITNIFAVPEPVSWLMVAFGLFVGVVAQRLLHKAPPTP
jgi:hypothetical protein